MNTQLHETVSSSISKMLGLTVESTSITKDQLYTAMREYYTQKGFIPSDWVRLARLMLKEEEV